MKKLEKIFLNEALACASGFSKELDIKLEDVKTFEDLMRAEKSLAKKLSYEESREIVLSEQQEVFNVNEFDQKDFLVKRNNILKEFDNDILTRISSSTTLKIAAISLLIYGIRTLLLNIGTIGVAASLGYGLYKLWERFLSDAARACNKFSGTNKSICMLQFRIKGAELTIDQLNESLSVCLNSENPGLCKYNIERQIKIWILKLAKFKKELAILQNKLQKPTKQLSNKKESLPPKQTSFPQSDGSKF